MTDLTLCENTLCPSHANCYRFIAQKWASERATHAAFAPDKGADKCDHYVAADPCARAYDAEPPM